MFPVERGVPMMVHSASSFIKKDGTPGAVILMLERENQPADMERPSKSSSAVKIWLDKLPEGIRNGSWIVLRGFDFHWQHPKSDYHKGEYSDVIELLNVEFDLCKIQPTNS